MRKGLDQLCSQVFKLRVSLPYLHGAAIQRLNSAVPDNVSPQAGRGPADDDVIVDGYTFGPEDLAVLRALVGVVLEPNGRGAAVVGRVGTQTAGVALVPLPVGRDDAAALWTSGGGFCPITSRRGGWVVDSFKARRLHPFTVAGWAGGASTKWAVATGIWMGIASG